jgi:hypothetical protein
VEERIYDMLDFKLQEIAHSIGKVDAQGQVKEDFRSEILGLLVIIVAGQIIWRKNGQIR